MSSSAAGITSWIRGVGVPTAEQVEEQDAAAVLFDEFLCETCERDAGRADAMDEEDLTACCGAPFVGAYAAVGRWDVTGTGERGWWVGAGGEVVGLGGGGRERSAVDFVIWCV